MVKPPRPLLRRLCHGALAAGMVAFPFLGPSAVAEVEKVAAPEPSLAEIVATAPYDPPENVRDLLKVDESMRSYFNARITSPRDSVERLREITENILRPDGLDFTYDTEGTFDARQTFARRRGNCVSFSVLVVAIAREFGFTATFQNVEAAMRWSRFGDIVVSVSHLNVRVETDDGAYLVDLRPDLLPSKRIEALREISDQRAFSEFYGTLGLFRLVHGGAADAIKYMKMAADLDPSLASNWTNLANVYARSGDLASARSCFERALRVDRYDLAAAAALLDILRHSGTPEDLKAAEKLERRAKAMRDRNPYWQERLAHQAESRGDWAEAEKFYRRAISLNDEELEFYGQWIATLRRLGRESEAQRAERKLEKIRTRVAERSVHFAS